MSTEVIKANELSDTKRPPEEARPEEAAPPLTKVQAMARPELFDTDEEADEFLVWLYESRRRNLA
jgi:hypothetical protein